jgi:hypothetical protein
VGYLEVVLEPVIMQRAELGDRLELVLDVEIGERAPVSG